MNRLVALKNVMGIRGLAGHSQALIGAVNRLADQAAEVLPFAFRGRVQSCPYGC